MESWNPENSELQIDLRGADFAEFLKFVFDHDVVPEASDEKEWYFRHELDVQAEPSRQVQFMSELFRRPGVLSARYSAPQIEQGFWFMFLRGAEWFMDPLWDPAIPRPEREACVLAIPELYTQLFERQAIGSAPNMLWDLLAHGLDDYPGRRPESSGEDEFMRDSMFRACTAMLQSTSPETQRAALHGLFHIEHAKGMPTIRAWLDSTPGLEEGTKAYAENVLAGTAI